jgi:hypothetical protein
MFGLWFFGKLVEDGLGTREFVAFYLLGIRRGMSRDEVMSVCNSAIQPAGVIILVTGAGGVFKQVLVDSGVGAALGNMLADSGLPIISQFDLDRAYRVRDAVWSMKQCEDLLTGCSIEENVQWTGYSSLVNCKAGIDAIGNNHIIDLKTCMDASPEGFAAQIRRFKYDLQAAHYLEAEVERDIHSFVFVAVETQPPYAVGIYKLDDNTLIRAFRSMDRIAATYKKCLETNNWPSYQSDITELVIPSFEKIDEDTIEAEDF